MQSAVYLTILSIAIVLGSFSLMNFLPALAAEVPATIVPGAGPKTTDAYDPYPINANVGDTVTWINKDSQPHTVTSGTNGQPDGKFDSSPNLSPLMAPQQTFSYTFEEEGEFPYYCALHPNMIGTVNVAIVDPVDDESSVTVTLNGSEYKITAKSATTKITGASMESGQDYTASFDKAGNVELMLPKVIFSEVTSVSAGEQDVDYEVIKEDDSTITIIFTVPEDNATIVIVPEFPLVAVLLSIGIAGIIAYYRLVPSRSRFWH
jgi:plastocyanin